MRALALILCMLAFALAACGSDSGKGLPESAAQSLLGDLDAVQARLGRDSVEACEVAAEQSIPEMEREVGGLPGDVEPSLRQALEESIDRLRTLTQEECDRRRREEEQEETETTPPPAPVPTTPAPPPTQTETTPPPTQTETTPEPDDEKEKEKDKGQDKDGGDGGGGGQGKGKGNGQSGGTAPEVPEAGEGGGTEAGALTPGGSAP